MEGIIVDTNRVIVELTMERQLNWRQKRIKNAYVMDTEWDLRISFKNNIKEELCQLLQRLQGHEFQDKTTWILVGGVECAKDEDDIPIGSKGHARSFHVHIALVFKEHQMQTEVKKLLKIAFDETGVYCQPRAARSELHDHWTYYGWRLHHIKYRTKLQDEELEKIGLKVDKYLLFESGEHPKEDLNAHKKEVLRVSSKYGTKEQQDEVRQLLDMYNKQARALQPKLKKTPKPRASRATVHPILKGKKQKKWTSEQMDKAKDRMKLWIIKVEKAETEDEREHCLNVLQKIRDEYFEP